MMNGTMTRAQGIGMLLDGIRAGGSLETIAERADIVASLARQELAERKAGGAIGVGLIVTPLDMKWRE